jgi:hypothetical protein
MGQNLVAYSEGVLFSLSVSWGMISLVPFLSFFAMHVFNQHRELTSAGFPLSLREKHTFCFVPGFGPGLFLSSMPVLVRRRSFLRRPQTVPYEVLYLAAREGRQVFGSRRRIWSISSATEEGRRGAIALWVNEIEVR